jgi:hypothetical protein
MPPRPWRRWWVGLGVALVSATALAVWVWHDAREGLAQVEREVDAALTADLWAAAQGQPAWVAGFGSEAQRTGWQAQTQREATTLQTALAGGVTDAPPAAAGELLDLGADWAVVRMTTPPRPGQSAYRQTRLYRRTASGWVRAMPSAAYWGAPRRLETRSFVFHYGALDEAAVKQAAVTLDRLYPIFYAAFLTDPPAGAKLIVEVTPEPLPGQMALHTSFAAPRVTASPGVYLAPETIGDADLLAQAVALTLLDDLATLVIQRGGTADAGTPAGRWNAQWYPLVEAMRLRQVWASDLPLAAWRVPVVRQFLGSAVSSTATVITPEFLPALCESYGLWQSVPFLTGIPLACAKLDLVALWQLAWPTPYTAPRQLASLTPVFPTADLPYDYRLGTTASGYPPHPANVVALATVVEYVEATYGPAQVPVLVAQLAEHTGWETLVPAVFGLPAAEFETGWQRYLAEQYGLAGPAL